jgi:hypothetical protein
MRLDVCWIDLPASARLAIMPRPRAGNRLDEEVAGWKAEGIDVIVSLLEAEEVAELGIHREVGLCHDLDIKFISGPVGRRGRRSARRCRPNRAIQTVPALARSTSGLRYVSSGISPRRDSWIWPGVNP